MFFFARTASLYEHVTYCLPLLENLSIYFESERADSIWAQIENEIIMFYNFLVDNYDKYINNI